MSKKLRQKFKYLENKKSFEDKIKSIFHHFLRTVNGKSPTLKHLPAIYF